MTTSTTMCVYCKHRRRHDKTKLACDAYPEGRGIPEEIFVGKLVHTDKYPMGRRGPQVDHTVAYPGDHGIQFEIADGADLEEFRRIFWNTRGVKSGRI